MIRDLSLELVTYGKGPRWNKNLFIPIVNRWVKPRGGLWCSPVDSNYGWKDWCRSENWGLDSLQEKFKVDYTGHTLIIDSFEDMKDMIYRKDPYGTIGIYCSQCPDFESILASGIDAIYLTEKGEERTRFTTPNLYGWDCECILVMNPDSIRDNYIKGE